MTGATRSNRINNREFKEIVNQIYKQEFSEENKVTKMLNNAKLIPTFQYDLQTHELTIGFKEQDDINSFKDLNKFYNTIQHKEELSKHDVCLTVQADANIYTIVLKKYVDIIHFTNGDDSYHKQYFTKKYYKEKAIVRLNALEDIMEYVVNNQLEISLNHQPTKLINHTMPIRYELRKDADNHYFFDLQHPVKGFQNVIYSKDRVYVIYQNVIYRCDRIFLNEELMILNSFLLNAKQEIGLKQEDLTSFFSLVMPKLQGRVEVKDQEIYQYKPDDLTIHMYLDFNSKQHIIVQILFEYNGMRFNPLLEDIKNANRNILKESLFLNQMRKTGFLYSAANKNFVLTNDDVIYKFISTGIEKYNQIARVYGTDEFNRKKSRADKKVSIGVKVDNGLLNIELSNLDLQKEELKEILQKYKLKKKYHRLKDGTFIDLEENSEIEFLDNLLSGLDISYKEIEEDIQIPVNRTLYLNRLLSATQNIEVTTNKEYDTLVQGMDMEQASLKVPKKLEGVLRDYQKVGYQWLRALDSYQFGGILADDMGLGKTVQILSVLLQYIQTTKKKARRASMVVSPSSLALNWYNEAKKFVPSVNVLVINGEATERKQKIESIENYDLIITSYDLLKRDMEWYKNLNYQFKFIVADEAQYIKNNNTKNAKAIKLMKADTRYALTGTPIENSLNELWSIFDFIMPGYLFTYKKFKQNYEMPIVRENDAHILNKLKMLIEPFILRRTKKEVLTELPDKATSVLDNEMVEEQERIYLSYLAQARDELNEEIEEKGFEQTRIKILALLTRLRQICCHPSLFIVNYKGESGKLNQCIELVKDGINSGHKILLFSGYTSMFEIIEKEFKSNHIPYLKLTGKTKVSERLELIDQFNDNDDIKVFLISLKAGGTGINLTSADMVIHYDPWWNLSVENQATDRTHRIGQTKKVQVYKLITKNSIEEKIYDLQKRKEELIDNMLSTDTKFINKLSKEDILGLFE